MPHEITHVQVVAHHRLMIFLSGEHREVHISRLVSFRGIFEPLKDPVFFRQVSVNLDLGTIAWSNGVDLCSDVLYAQSRARGAGHAA
jgi:hypothetical protein